VIAAAATVIRVVVAEVAAGASAYWMTGCIGSALWGTQIDPESDLKEVAWADQLCSVAAGTAALWVMPALLDPGKQLWPSPDTCQVADQVRKHPALAASKGSYQIHQNLTTEDQGLQYLEATRESEPGHHPSHLRIDITWKVIGDRMHAFAKLQNYKIS